MDKTITFENVKITSARIVFECDNCKKPVHVDLDLRNKIVNNIGCSVCHKCYEFEFISNTSHDRLKIKAIDGSETITAETHKQNNRV
jgi:hypothetical protein